MGRRLLLVIVLLSLLGLCGCGSTPPEATAPAQSPPVTEPPSTVPPTETVPPLTGWVEEAGERYYYDAGIPVSGWLDLDDGRYFLDDSGAMVTGWLEWDDRRFYLCEDGTAAAGKQIIDDTVYYFSSWGEHIPLVNRWNPVPEGFSVELETTEDGCTVDVRCINALREMVDACRAAGRSPGIMNGYRSYTNQHTLFYENIQSLQESGVSYNSAYDQTIASIALPGTSEHELGLAVDILDAYNPESCTGEVNAVAWLDEHCWEYGFIVRYPESKPHITGVIYEPWHYRYVGKELAMELRDSGLCLEEYLDSLTNDGTTCGNPDALITE